MTTRTAMDSNLIKRLLGFGFLLLAQALVLNHIHLFNFATPLLAVYIVVLFRRNYPRSGILVWSFMMGLFVDVFSNTPGVSAVSMTLIGLIQPYLLMLFIPRDSPEDLEPTINSLGTAKFMYYTILLVLTYCLLFFTLETFNFFNWQQWAEAVGGSTVLTVILILVIENMRKSNS